MSMDWHSTLVKHLADALARQGVRVQVLQTHISTVLLAWDDAYKLKKPLALPFLDFSTLAQREHCCREECRLNRRTAPELYLGVLPVLGPLDAPRLGKCDEAAAAAQVLDWVVHMRCFPQEALLAEQARAGRLTASTVDALADHVAAFHAALPVLPASAWPAKDVVVWARESLDELAVHPARPAQMTPQSLADMRGALLGRLEALGGWQKERQQDGWLREGHGDLHLGNVVAWQDGVRAFDAIEFSAELRCIDVMNDAAFAFMDLLAHGLPVLAWRFINRYVEQTGDYEGLVGLRAFAAYRAVVRAKVAVLSAAGDAGFERYWQTAGALLAPGAPPRLVLTMGLSGSGKTTAAQMLQAALAQQGEGMVRVRSDVERKRLFGLAAQQRPSPVLARELYAAPATEQTYNRLQHLAGVLLRAGFSVVLDAAFLKQAERAAMRHLAQQHGAAFALLECVANRARMHERLQARQTEGTDASDATPEVLARQAGFAEPVPPAWADVHWCLHNDGTLSELAQAVAALLQRWHALPNWGR